MKKILIIALILIVLIGAKVLFFPSVQPNKTMNGNKVKTATPVSVHIITETDFNQNISFAGSVLANEEVNMKAELAGRITFLNIKEGSTVKKGELLVKINDVELLAQLKKLNVQQKLATEKDNRLKELLKINGISQDEYDAANSNLQYINADIEVLKAQIEKAEMRAPFDGTIGFKNVSIGSYVNPADVIVSIQQINPVKIDFSIPEKYISFVKVGDKIKVSLEGKQKIFPATIYAINPQINVSTRTLNIRALCENSKKEILPGSYAHVEMNLSSQKTILVPTMAIIPELRGKKAFIVKNGKAVEVKLEAGIRTDSTIQILSGLSIGDTLVTSGMMMLKPESPVKIQSIK